MLKGIEKNLKDNYNQIIDLKRKDQLKTKEDVPIIEAFELYMLKKISQYRTKFINKQNVKFLGKRF